MRGERQDRSDEAGGAGGGVIQRPSYSGRTVALLLVLCLVFAAAIALPLMKWMPLWLRMETVLGVWWLGWTIALTVLLYRGALVDDDVQLNPPRTWFGRSSKGDGTGATVAQGLGVRRPHRGRRLARPRPSRLAGIASPRDELTEGVRHKALTPGYPLLRAARG